MSIVTIANQKGGVGKTTTAVNLAHGAALRGLDVLIIDLDTQGNVADALGMDEGQDLYNWLINEDEFNEVVTQSLRKNLDVIRSNKMTSQLKMTLAGMDFREQVLINSIRGNFPVPLDSYDLIILDCPPSVDVLHTAALVAADLLIIPTKLDQFAIKGVIEMLRSLDSVQRATRSRCKLAGIIPTFYDKVTNESQAQLENLAENYRALVWPPIAADTNCRVANRVGKTLWEMNGFKKALLGYAECLERLLKII